MMILVHAIEPTVGTVTADATCKIWLLRGGRLPNPLNPE
jgi:hypothetical protein